MYTIEYLFANSKLPGPRGNLELLYLFAKEAKETTINQCLSYLTADVANSPAEFVGMCGIVGYAVLHKAANQATIEFLQPYASHPSWRIREAVAIGIQEIAETVMDMTIENLAPLIKGNPYEQRAVVAGLCEPKLLNEQRITIKVLDVLEEITQSFDHHRKLTDAEASLRKALAYGWSVAIVHAPTQGKAIFERLSARPEKHIQWIIKENLKKNRLQKMDKAWVQDMEDRLYMTA